MPTNVPESQFLRELHFIEVMTGSAQDQAQPRHSSLGNCTSLRLAHLALHAPVVGRSSFGNCTSLRPSNKDFCEHISRSQFLRDLHFIEARRADVRPWSATCRSSFGNCTSLRLGGQRGEIGADKSQFLLELHFIEVERACPCWGGACRRSSFGNCTSLRHSQTPTTPTPRAVAVPSGTALH